MLQGAVQYDRYSGDQRQNTVNQKEIRKVWNIQYDDGLECFWGKQRLGADRQDDRARRCKISTCASKSCQKSATKRQNRCYQMEMFLKSQYLGLSQLLAVPLPKPRCLDGQGTSTTTIGQKAADCSRQGFVPFKVPSIVDCSEQLHGKSTTEEPCSSFHSESEESMMGQVCGKSNGCSVKSKKGPYRKYTIEEKKQAVEHLNNGRDLKSVSRQFNIPRRNLLRWRKNGCQRKEGGGRPTDFQMETRLLQTIKVHGLNNEKSIRDLAKRMSTLKNFKASKGWFVKFCRRFDLKEHFRESLKEIVEV